MKLKEKIALEYAEDYKCEGHYGATQEAVIYGFEKAREMATNIANREGLVEREIYTHNYPHSDITVLRSEAIALQINRLGEDEVCQTA